MKQLRSSGLVALAAAALLSCKGGGREVSLSKKSLEADADPGTFTYMEVAESDKRLLAKVPGVRVFTRPSKSSPQVGTLDPRSSVARSDKTVRPTDQCEGGYFAVRPRGFVCADESVDPAAGPSAGREGATDAALPYRYGVVRSVTPLYARAPSAEEQSANEPDLSKHLAKVAKLTPKALGVGANDVPVDERGVAAGVATLGKTSTGLDDQGKRTSKSFLRATPLAAPPARPDRASAPLVSKTLRKGSGVAIVASVELPGPQGPRSFGVTPDDDLVPLDRLDAILGSAWHGVDLTKEKTLPMGFVLRHEVAPYALGTGKAERLEDEEVERRSHVHLTGRFRTVENVRYEETDEGVWFRDRDLIKVIKRNRFPEFVVDGTKWIDVSIALQTFTLYEGKKPIYTTLTSTGRDVLGPKDVPFDPSMAVTQQGTFTVTTKALTTTLDPREVSDAFEVNHAPWALGFAPGTSIVGSYHSDASGEAKQFHNVALTPIDARRVFLWAGPELPRGFSELTLTKEESVIVHVRK